MIAQRINNSSTTARYRVLFTSPEEQHLSADQVADLIVPHNFGARWVHVGEFEPMKATLDVYID